MRGEETIFFLSLMFKQREGKEEEKKSKLGTLIFVSMEYLYGTYMYGTYMYGLLVWICWLGNPPNSLFAYDWGVRRTLSLYKSDFLSVLVQFCGWF